MIGARIDASGVRFRSGSGCRSDAHTFSSSGPRGAPAAESRAVAAPRQDVFVRPVEDGNLIYHLALRSQWESAVMAGEYRGSTLGRSLEEEGFIHCSFARQVQAIADLVYRGRDDVVLLTIDPGLVPAELRYETPDGGSDAFPHIYGPLPIGAVLVTDILVPDATGRLECPLFPHASDD